MSQPQPLPMPPFKAFLASNIPSVYDNTLTYYEELTKLIAYLEQMVVPQVNKNTADIAAYADGLKELKDYVDHYFDNLDVQEEINNKLDDMAEKGELAEIIAQFLELGPVFAFDTVSDMADAENLVAGCVAKTLGYSAAGDGKAAFYKIEALDSQVIDGNIYIAVGDSLVAHKNTEYAYADTTNPIYYGADPTGTVDSAAAIQACIDANEGGAVVFTPGKYVVNSSIDTPYYTDESVSINFNGATLYTENALTYVLGIATKPHGTDMPNHDNYSTGRMGYAIFHDFVIDAVNSQIGIYTEQNYWLPKIFNATILGTIIGIKVGNNAASNWSSNVILDNVYIQCKDYKNTSTRGLVINGHDNRITRLTICNAFIGIENNKGGIYFQDILIYLYGHLNERNTQGFIETFPNTIGILENGEANKYIGVYIDTYGTMFKFGGSGNYNGVFENCDYFTNTSGYDLTMFDFTNRTFDNLVIRDSQFRCFEPATTNGHIGIKLNSNQPYDMISRVLTLSGNRTEWINAPDLLRTSKDIRCAYPYNGANPMAANKYYVMGYIPVGNYVSVTVGIGDTGTNKQRCRFYVDGSYNLSINNIGTSGSDCAIGGKLVNYHGQYYIEISVMFASETAANKGIYYEKDLNNCSIGIVPALDPQIPDGMPIEVTPSIYTTFSL